MKIVIIEDDAKEQDRLVHQIEEWSMDKDVNVKIRTYNSAENFYSKNENYDCETDLFLLDIELFEIDGLEVAKDLRRKKYEGDIIFVTAFRDYVYEGYNVHAFNYLIKPVNQQMLNKCLDEIEQKKHANCYVYKNKHTETILIPYKDIIVFSSNKHYVDITLTDVIYTQYINLNTVYNLLPDEFVRVHRSCVVNMSHILKVSHNKVFLSNKTSIDIGRYYACDFKQTFLNYITRFNKRD